MTASWIRGSGKVSEGILNNTQWRLGKSVDLSLGHSMGSGFANSTNLDLKLRSAAKNVGYWASHLTSLCVFAHL